MVSHVGRRPIDAASVYARRGWPVFPCHQPAPGACGCSCGNLGCASPGKHPRVPGGLNAATTDGTQITTWWSRWPKANIGLRTGAASGLVVIDIDPDHGGDETMDRLTAHGSLPAGRTVRTGSGGRHLYFGHPGGLVRNDAGRRLGPGIDVRGDGGYIIAPPSRHRSGRQYVVASHGGNIPELPDWLLVALEPPVHRPQVVPAPEPTGVRAAAWARAALDGELDRLDHAVEGTRNDTLNRVAYRLGQIISSGRLQQADVEPLLLQHGVATGLPEREVQATIRSGLRAADRSAELPP